MTDDPVSVGEAESLYHHAMSLLEQGDLESAEEALLKALDIAPDTSTCRRLIEIQLARGENKRADRFIAMAYQLNPRNDKGAFEYAHLLLRLQRTQEAREVLEDIVARNADYKPAAKLLDTFNWQT